ncbi:MAG: flippase-like domain-containing protein [Deltaproteobacteria bacterium]|nr:flippase-like domain-containing protein [Deltaproteobacteria bacterium]
MKRASPVLVFLLKALVSLGFLSFLLSRIDITQLLGVLSSVHLSYLVVALTGYFLGQIISSVRWTLLARPLGFENPFKDFVAFYLIGMFFNLFAPSTVGGDVGRVFYLARGGKKGQERERTGSTANALVSVIADRAIGMVVLVWIAAVALVVFPRYALPFIVRYPTFALAVGLFLGWMFFPLLNRFLQRRGHPMVKHLYLALETYRTNRQVLPQAIILSLVIHFIQSWIQILLGRALDLEIPWSYCLILYPLVALFSALPISFNGIGLREGGYLFLLRQIDISSEKAFAFGLLWFIIIALDSLIGGVVFMLIKSPKPSAVVSEITNQIR